MQYFHWFFMTQPAPFPETLIGNSLEPWLRRFLGGSFIAPEAFVFLPEELPDQTLAELQPFLAG